MNNRDFTSEYVFREYPKWVTLVDGSQVLVDNAEEEAVLTKPKEDDTETERLALLEKAREMGLKVHPATGIEKLRAAIEAKG